MAEYHEPNPGDVVKSKLTNAIGRVVLADGDSLTVRWNFNNLQTLVARDSVTTGRIRMDKG